MKSESVITIDVSRSSLGPWVDAVQGDGGTRSISISLLDNGNAWYPPHDAEAAIAYTHECGGKGLYNKLPDGRSAISIKGNTVTAILAPKVLSRPGKVRASIVFTNSKMDQLTSFPFTISVARNQFAGSQEAEDYIRLQWLECKLGEYLQKAKDSGEFNGPKGDAFTYADFTQEQLEALTGPPGPEGDNTAAVEAAIAANDAAKRANDAASEAHATINAIVPEVNLLKARLSEMDNSLFSNEFVYAKKLVSDIGEKHAGFNGTVPNSTLISIGDSPLFDTYLVPITEDTSIYIDQTDIPYFALCIGIDPCEEWNYIGTSAITRECETAYRIRKNLSTFDDGFPASFEEKLDLKAGTALAITVTKDTIPVIYIKEPTKIVSRNFAESVHAVNQLLVKRSESTLILASSKYQIVWEKKATTQGYQWNIVSLCGVLSDWNILPANTDIIGVMQFDASQYEQPNFMGGMHGNENVIQFRVLANGSEVVDSGYYDNVQVCMVSHLYDIVETDQNVVDRYVLMHFTPHGFESRVSFQLLVDQKVQVAYPSGLFAVKKSDVESVITNVGILNLNGTGQQLKSTGLKEAVFHLSNKLTLSISSDTGDFGFFTYRENTQSFKLYWANSSLAEKKAGDIMSGFCRYQFSC